MTTFNNLDISGGEMYDVADGIIIDEGGIDLLVDGEPRLAVSFYGLDPYELMYAILPEDFELPEHMSKADWNECVAELETIRGTIDEEDIPELVIGLEGSLRLILLQLAAINGWKKP